MGEEAKIEINGLSGTSAVDNDRVSDQLLSQQQSANSLSFHNIVYTVKVGKPCKKVDKVILRNVSGIFEPGLNAIMGPTGGGKTSLLDLLAKRKDSKGLEGEIMLNGKMVPKNFKLISGYVVQDDVVLGTLTVRENIQFAANMRMRGNLSHKKKAEWVEELLRDLGLEKCKDTKVGTDLIKGVSGGERKRCNIGIELVTKPPVLFLDEPTTGLDASTSFHVLTLLRELADQGNRIIIFSIHQPRFAIYRLFDRLHLLSSFGQTVYHGPANQAVDYFAAQGLVCEQYNNPPDFFLDIILKNSGSSEVVESAVDDDQRLHVESESEKRHLAQLFASSPENERLIAQCDALSLKANELPDDTNKYEVGYAVSWCAQFYHLSVRAFKNLIRNPQTSAAPSVMVIVLSLIIGILYCQWTTDMSGFQNLFGALFFATLQMMFGNMAALEVFIEGRNLFLHESANGFYQVSAYFVSKIVCDLIPLRALPTIIFSTIFYFFLRLKLDFGLYMFFVLVNLLATMSACSLAFFFSVLTGVFSVAQALVSISYVIMILFTGLTLNVESIPKVLQPLKYISIPRYTLEAHCSAQITGLNFCGNISMEVNGSDISMYTCQSGDSLLDHQGIDYGLAERWINCSCLLGFAIVFFGLTYLVLRLIPKKK